jgi:hypothetical protein
MLDGATFEVVFYLALLGWRRGGGAVVDAAFDIECLWFGFRTACAVGAWT